MSSPHAGLEIFIIGGRHGESIIIHTPGDRFGIVDSYASDWINASTNPTLSRLKAMGVSKLQFVALTHPHMDHFRGLPAIFDAYPGQVELFWRPPWGTVELLDAIMREFEATTDEDKRTRLARGLQILIALFNRVDGEIKSKKLKRITLQNDSEALYDGIILQELEHDFSVMCLGPSTDISIPYLNRISDKTIGPAVRGENPEWRGPHNEISSVLAIKYRNWIGILGGDTEKASWRDIIRRRVALIKSAQFFKVSHHGSETGSFPELWETIESDKCEAVITCFAGQRLPNSTGLRHLRHSRFSLHSTNSVLATQLYEDSSKAVPYALGINKRVGEVRVAVQADGTTSIEYVDPAGALDL
jgi:hypothetical protein